MAVNRKDATNSVSGKRADKSKQTEIAKNFDERTKLLKEIVRICTDIPRHRALQTTMDVNVIGITAEGEDVSNDQERMKQLVDSWGRHGYLLGQLIKGSDINFNEFFEALFPSLEKGSPKVVELAVHNFEFFLDLAEDGLLPRVQLVYRLIKSRELTSALMYKLLAMLAEHHGQYLEITTEMPNYTKDFKETNTVEALDFFTAMLKTCEPEMRPMAYELLEVVSKGDHLRTNTAYLRCFNALLGVCLRDLSIKPIADELNRRASDQVFLHPEYTKELHKFRLYYKTFEKETFC